MTSPMRGIKLASWSNKYAGQVQSYKTHDNRLLGLQCFIIVMQMLSVFCGYSEHLGAD